MTQYKPKRRPWTAAEVDQLTREYADTKTSTLALRMGWRTEQVYTKAVKLGLKKSARYLASPDACHLRRGDNVGAAYRFPPGHVPANKGLRRPGWYAGNMRATQFKKGQRGCKYLPIGTEIFRSDGYLYRKLTDTGYPPRDWKQVHRLIWEQYHGPIPAGYHVRFIDDNRKNVALLNLCLVSRQDLAALNRMWNRYPRELCEVIQLRGALNRRINRRLKHEKPHRRSA